jgi:hypothetical protein
MPVIDLTALSAIALTEFADVVQTTTIISGKLRVVLNDASYIDFWWSQNLPGRFAHHWERTHVDGRIYRHDNAPHTKWAAGATFPQHFHCETDGNVQESHLSTHPETAVREFLTFARTLV